MKCENVTWYVANPEEEPLNKENEVYENILIKT